MLEQEDHMKQEYKHTKDECQSGQMGRPDQFGQTEPSELSNQPEQMETEMPKGADRKLRIYVCSPLRPKSDAKKEPEQAKKELYENLDRAKMACKLVMNLGAVPICSHLFCTAFLDDDIPSERKQGMELGLEMLKDADEMWCFSERISEGMAAEISEASKLDIPVRMFCESDGLLDKIFTSATKPAGTAENAGNKEMEENHEDYEEDEYGSEENG